MTNETPDQIGLHITDSTYGLLLAVLRSSLAFGILLLEIHLLEILLLKILLFEILLTDVRLYVP